MLDQQKQYYEKLIQENNSKTCRDIYQLFLQIQEEVNSVVSEMKNLPFMEKLSELICIGIQTLNSYILKENQSTEPMISISVFQKKVKSLRNKIIQLSHNSNTPEKDVDSLLLRIKYLESQLKGDQVKVLETLRQLDEHYKSDSAFKTEENMASDQPFNGEFSQAVIFSKSNSESIYSTQSMKQSPNSKVNISVRSSQSFGPSPESLTVNQPPKQQELQKSSSLSKPPKQSQQSSSILSPNLSSSNVSPSESHDLINTPKKSKNKIPTQNIQTNEFNVHESLPIYDRTPLPIILDDSAII